MSWVPNAPTGLSVLPAFVNTPTISTSSLPSGEAGLAYSFQLVGTGGTQPYTWSASGLPAGMSCNAAGMLSGTPTSAFSGNVTINLTDANSATAPPRVLSLTIIAGPVVSTTSLPQATVGSAYSFQMTATGGTPGYTWAASGLPTGLGISSSGLITGTPTATGTPTVVFTATDSVGVASPGKSLTLTVNSASSGVFIPDAGYTYSGPVAWDSSGFIINKTGGGFGATGPITLMATDFRNTTPGNAVAAGTTGYAGSSTWANGGGTFGYNGNPVSVASGNGTGNFVRVRTSGDTDTQQEQLTLNFANCTDFFECWGENSNGLDYNAVIANGGNNFNYKMTWLTFNGHTSGAFNMVCPIFQLATAGVAGSNILINSNDGIKSGGPLPDWFVSGATGWFDPNNWNTIEVEYSGDPTNPTTGTNTTESLAITSPTNKRVALVAANPGGTNPNTNVLFNSGSGSQGTYSVANGVFFPGLMQGFPTTAVVYRADYYASVGKQRFVIGDQSTIAACTTLIPFTIDQLSAPAGTPAGGWTDGSVSMTPRRGSRGAPAVLQGCGWHLYVRTATAPYAHVGVFGTPFTPDFVISPTGSDSNAGTAASPWAITSLTTGSANYASIAGHKIGLMDGTYDVSTFALSAFTAKLTIPAGTASNPTVIQSINPLKAILFTDPAKSGYVQGPTIGNGANGVGSTQTPANITLRGLTVTTSGAVPSSLGTSGISFCATTDNTGVNVLIDGCHIYNFVNASGAVNIGGVGLGPGMFGVTINNCHIHDIYVNGVARNAHSNASGIHDYAKNTVVQYCTIHDCNNAIYQKNNGQGPPQGAVIRYNYFWYGNSGMSISFAGFNNAEGTTPPYTATQIYNNVMENVGHYGNENDGPDFQQAPWQFHNNTSFWNNTNAFRGVGGIVGPTTGAPWKFASYYNDIIYRASGVSSDSERGDLTLGPTFGDWTIVDFNCWPSNAQFGVATGNSAIPSSLLSLASWKTQTGTPDTHSITSDPLFTWETGTWTAGAGATQYKLQATSPCKGTGQSGVDMGAWGGTDVNTGQPIAQIGSSF